MNTKQIEENIDGIVDLLKIRLKKCTKKQQLEYLEKTIRHITRKSMVIQNRIDSLTRNKKDETLTEELKEYISKFRGKKITKERLSPGLFSDSRPTSSRSRGAKCATDLQSAGMTKEKVVIPSRRHKIESHEV